jgi:hypothetical protein
MAALGQPTPMLVAAKLLRHQSQRPQDLLSSPAMLAATRRGTGWTMAEAQAVTRGNSRELSTRLSEEEEREAGFPERKFGETLQRVGMAEQEFYRAITAYVEAFNHGSTPMDLMVVAGQAGNAWTRLVEQSTPEEVEQIAADLGCTDREIRDELFLHKIGWMAMLPDRDDEPDGVKYLKAMYRLISGNQPPRLSGSSLWRALTTSEQVDPEWEERWREMRAQLLGSRRNLELDDEDPIPTRANSDEVLEWALTLPEDFIQEVVGADPAEVKTPAEAKEAIIERLKSAARWACYEAAEKHGIPWLTFLRKVVMLCRGLLGRDKKALQGKVWGYTLDPKPLAGMIDLPGLFREVRDEFENDRTLQKVLWSATEIWISHPFKLPELPLCTGPALRLAQAAFSLLPDPPISRKMVMGKEETEETIRQIGPYFFPHLEGGPLAERMRRFVLGVVKKWLSKNGELPILTTARTKREALYQATLEVLSGHPEESTARKMANAVLQTLPDPIITVLPLPTKVAHERLSLGVPYFFPTKNGDGFDEARRVVLGAVKQFRQEHPKIKQL